ncbi:MAG: hypothetical protein JXR49_19315 [Acidobacteria bacterium]|nr:hypothetical protein [Acidobacteriota bacterium]
MKCSYHPEVDSRHVCSACKKFLCDDCAIRIKEKAYCRECLAQGAEWVATAKDFRLPSDSPRRAALFAIIPGIGAVYNNEYLKAVTFFTVFAALVVMGDTLNHVFGFGAFVFLIFTMFDAYRTAEKGVRRQMQSEGSGEESGRTDSSLIGWGVFLILAGALFLLQNVLSHYFLVRMWPAIFILIGAYLVYLSVRGRKERDRDMRDPGSSIELNKKE